MTERDIHRIDEQAGGDASRIAHIGRAEYRQHEIWIARRAPYRECLAGIFFMMREAPVGGGIEQADDAHRGVDDETGARLVGALHLALEHVVHGRPRQAQIGERHMDPFAGRVRHAGAVPPRHRLDEHLVEEAVDLENIAIGRLERIARLFDLGDLIRGVLNHAASDGEQGRQDAGEARIPTGNAGKLHRGN
jgi:hypothetical protein